MIKILCLIIQASKRGNLNKGGALLRGVYPCLGYPVFGGGNR